MRRAGTSPWSPDKMDGIKTKVLPPDLLGSKPTYLSLVWGLAENVHIIRGQILPTS